MIQKTCTQLLLENWAAVSPQKEKRKRPVKTHHAQGRIAGNRGPKRVDLTGLRFGRLLVLELGPVVVTKAGKKRAQWNCKCDCGNLPTIEAQFLKRGETKSCGCLRIEKIANQLKTHGLKKTHPIEYSAWKRMRSRCNNPNSKDYYLYGGRGISVCSRWDWFPNFLEDMGLRPSKIHSLDRYPNNCGNYEPGNCRWATPIQQSRNRRPYSEWIIKPKKNAIPNNH